MSAQPDSSGGLSRDYIVEYRAGQFQNGSLVLRFDSAPSEKQLRDALLAYGLPSHALEEVRARPMSSIQPRTRTQPAQRFETPAPATTTVSPGGTRRRKKASGCSGGQLFMGLAIAAFGVLAAFAEDAQRAGESAGTIQTTETMIVGCWENLGIASSFADPDVGLLGGLFSQEPTSFIFTPANTAFYFSCLGSASSS